jgi:endonuclease-3
MTDTIQDAIHHIEAVLLEKFPTPFRYFGLEELNFENISEWRFRRLVANILVGGSRDQMAVKATEWIFDNFTLNDLIEGTSKTFRSIADHIEQEFDIKYAGKKTQRIFDVAAITNGEVPDSLKELEALPGVGHHAASVMMALAFNEYQNVFAVDLHVRRIVKRMGLVGQKTKDVFIEKLFLKAAQKPGLLSRAFVEFGQHICRYRPSCKKCPFAVNCPKNIVEEK